MALAVQENQRLHQFILFITFVTFLLIIAGGLVTGNEAGLSVPDWPLSYGSLIPPMEGNIRYEHTHRIIAALVGLLIIILMFGGHFMIRQQQLVSTQQAILNLLRQVCHHQ